MKNIIRIVFSQDDIEKIVKDHIQSSIPDVAKCYYKHSGKWEDFSTYRKESEECIMIEFSLEDADKEREKKAEGKTEGGELPWNSTDETESSFL